MTRPPPDPARGPADRAARGPLRALLARLRHGAARRATLAPWPTRDAFAPVPDGGVVVGGAVRDARLGRAVRDVDWLVPDPAAAAHALAERVDGTPVEMDAERGHWRVATAGGRTLDLAPLAGPLEADLARRDYTVNAMAVGPDGPVDPLGGADDLAAGRLVACGPDVLADDPIRGLRGVRLAATHALAWEPATRAAAADVADRLAAGTLPRPAAERLRDELTELLGAPRPGTALADAHALGWLALLLPDLAAGEGVAQGGLHHRDVLHHQLEALDRLVAAFPDAGTDLRLATLLHDVGKPACAARGPMGRRTFHGHAEHGATLTAAALRRLRFPRATVHRAAALVGAHMVPLPTTERAARRFVHRRAELLPDLLALMLADREAARGRLANEASRRRYREAVGRVLAVHEAAPPPAPLLRGEDVMALLDLPPGPRVGEALRFVEEARAVGDVRDAEEARAALRRYADRRGWRAS